MNVGELRDLLELLDDDLPVHIATGNCRHVIEMVLMPKRLGEPLNGVGHGPHLTLRAQGPGDPLWYESEPPWTLRGRWPTAEMDEDQRERLERR